MSLEGMRHGVAAEMQVPEQWMDSLHGKWWIRFYPRLTFASRGYSLDQVLLRQSLGRRAPAAYSFRID